MFGEKCFEGHEHNEGGTHQKLMSRVSPKVEPSMSDDPNAQTAVVNECLSLLANEVTKADGERLLRKLSISGDVNIQTDAVNIYLLLLENESTRELGKDLLERLLRFGDHAPLDLLGLYERDARTNERIVAVNVYLLLLMDPSTQELGKRLLQDLLGREHQWKVAEQVLWLLLKDPTKHEFGMEKLREDLHSNDQAVKKKMQFIFLNLVMRLSFEEDTSAAFDIVKLLVEPDDQEESLLQDAFINLLNSEGNRKELFIKKVHEVFEEKQTKLIELLPILDDLMVAPTVPNKVLRAFLMLFESLDQVDLGDVFKNKFDRERHAEMLLEMLLQGAERGVGLRCLKALPSADQKEIVRQVVERSKTCIDSVYGFLKACVGEIDPLTEWFAIAVNVCSEAPNFAEQFLGKCSLEDLMIFMGTKGVQKDERFSEQISALLKEGSLGEVGMQVMVNVLNSLGRKKQIGGQGLFYVKPKRSKIA